MNRRLVRRPLCGREWEDPAGAAGRNEDTDTVILIVPLTPSLTSYSLPYTFVARLLSKSDKLITEEVFRTTVAVFQYDRSFFEPTTKIKRDKFALLQSFQLTKWQT